MIPDNLRVSVGQLWDEFGTTDAPLAGAAINVSLGALGLVPLILGLDVAIQVLGLAWAIVNWAAVLQWVISQ